jgi:glycosyltransferase involved in cell wall biosynthesis
VFPNAIVSLPDIRNFDSPHMSLFFGALNRERDWQPLMPLINAVAAKAGNRLRFQVIHDRLFFDALETPHKTFTPTCDYGSYLRILGESDLCIMPLGDTPFNRAKSDLKFIEAAACRVVSLASPVVYAASIQDQKTGMIFRDPLELRSALLRVLAYPEAARKLADAARDYVKRERMLAYQVQARTDWYRALWSRRDDLNAALAARMPALFA